jgi:hypothetical protein
VAVALAVAVVVVVASRRRCLKLTIIDTQQQFVENSNEQKK